MAVEAKAHGRSPADPKVVVGGLLSSTVTEVAKRVSDLVPRADLDLRDTDYIRETLPGLRMLAGCARTASRPG
ncbi:MAG: hypothetical protein ACYC91_16270 [Solirubrobacteraceae bacterium]